MNHMLGGLVGIIVFAIAGALVLLVGFIGFSRLYYNRSAMATVADICLRILNGKSHFSDAYKYTKYMAARTKKRGKYKIRFVRFKSSVKEYIFRGAQVFRVYKSENPDAIVIYLHGGAYATQALSFHWRFCDKLAQRGNVEIIFPIYPLIPWHSWSETYEMLEDLYRDLIEKTDKPVIIMGDSAGGGLGAGFCEYLGKIGLRQPDELVLFSPWVDISMSNPRIPDFENQDPMLAVDGLRSIGLLWAHRLDTHDYRVSPMFGDVSCLRNVTLYVGTREILFPDIEDFYNKLKENGVDTVLHCGKGLNHVYPLYPIPEGRRAIEIICNTIRSKYCREGEKI